MLCRVVEVTDVTLAVFGNYMLVGRFVVLGYVILVVLYPNGYLCPI